MVDRFLEFIKSKLFLGGLGVLVLGIAVANYFSYANEKANEVEFQKFQNVNQQLVLESEIENLINETDLSFDKLGFEIITKSVIAKKALDEGKYQVALDLFMEAYVKISESKIRKETKDILLKEIFKFDLFLLYRKSLKSFSKIIRESLSVIINL